MRSAYFHFNVPVGGGARELNVRRLRTMNFAIHPFFAGAEGYGAAMAQFELVKAYAAAGAGLTVAFLPWWRRGTRWLCLAFAVVTAYLVVDLYRGNVPLPWSLAVLLSPLLISLASVVLAWFLWQRSTIK